MQFRTLLLLSLSTHSHQYLCENLYSRNWSNVRFGPELKRGGSRCCFSKAENFWNKNEHRMSFHIPGGGVAIMSSSGIRQSFPS